MLLPKVLVHEILTFIESRCDVVNVLLEIAEEMMRDYDTLGANCITRFVLQSGESFYDRFLPLVGEWEAHLALETQDRCTVNVIVQWEHWEEPDLDIKWEQQLVPCFSLERSAPRELKALPRTILIEADDLGINAFLISATHLTTWLFQPEEI